jgi:hypothetical protein
MATAGNIEVYSSPEHHKATQLLWVLIDLKSTSFHPEDVCNKFSENVCLYIPHKEA